MADAKTWIITSVLALFDSLMCLISYLSMSAHCVQKGQVELVVSSCGGR